MGVAPSEAHPVSQGRLCARGWAAHEASRWGARLLYPQVRAGGVLRRAAWDDALATAVLALDRLRYDGRALGVLGSGRASNEENFLAVALARSALRTGSVDAALRQGDQTLLSSRADADVEPPASLDRLEHADVIVVIADDLATSHPRLAMGVLRALRRGGQLITVGWHRSELSELAAAHLVFSAADPSATLRALKQARADAATADASAHATASAHIAAAASLLAHARHASIVLAPFDADATVLADCARAVRALADDMAMPSGERPLVLSPPVRANGRGALDMGVTPDALPGRAPLADAAARERLRAIWHGAPCWDAGIGAGEMLGQVNGLVVVADDPTSCHRWPSRAMAALETLDTLVVLDSFESPASQAAHVVLPIAAFGEMVGTLTNFEGRVQRWNACVSPRGEARPGWRVLRDLLAGLGATFAPDSLEEVQRAIQLAIPQYAAHGADDLARPGGVLLAPEDATPHTRGAAPAAKLHRRVTLEREAVATPGGWVLRRVGAFDWDDDPLVRSSPVLRRGAASERRQRPDGVVWINADDAAALGVKDGWRVRIRSAAGVVEVPVATRADQPRSALCVPFAHRERLSAIAGDAGLLDVEVSRA